MWTIQPDEKVDKTKNEGRLRRMLEAKYLKLFMAEEKKRVKSMTVKVLIDTNKIP